MYKSLACLCLSVVMPLAIADATPPPAVDSTAPPTCVQPPIPNASGASDPEASRVQHKGSDFSQQVKDYQVCMKAYIDGQGALSKAHIAAANAAVKTVNDYGQQVNDSMH